MNECTGVSIITLKGKLVVFFGYYKSRVGLACKNK